MDYEAMFPGRFLKCADLNGKDYTLKIERIDIEELEGDQGKKVKGIVTLEGAKKQLVLNRSNAESIKVMFGRETNAWIGKRITLKPDVFNDEPCIRLRGSPDIEHDVTFELKLPKRKPKQTTLKKTTA